MSQQTQTTLDYRSSLLEKPVGQTIAGLSPAAWVRIGILVLLLAALFWPNLRRLWLKTNLISGESNWQHATFVPLVGLYYLYLNRQALLKAKVEPLLWGRFLRPGRLLVGAGLIAIGGGMYGMVGGNEYIQTLGAGLAFFGLLVVALDWGLAIVVYGLLTYAYGIWPGQNDFIKDFGMVIVIFGVTLVLCGWEVMKIAWFPIAFLVCAIPWPGLVYSWVAIPLQKLAAVAAVVVLKATNVDAVQNGTTIRIFKTGLLVRELNVAEACAGLKALMTFIFLGGAVGFLSQRPLWEKLLISVSAVPIAIFCNMMRVAGQGLLDHYVSTEVSEGFAHQFVGLVMLIPAFFMLHLVGWVLDNMFVEEIDRKKLAATTARDGVNPTRSGEGKKGVESTELAEATRRLMAAASIRSRRPDDQTRPSSRSLEGS